MKSTNGGKSWTSQPLPIKGPSGITVISANIAYACGSGVAKTIDGGNTWTLLSSLPLSAQADLQMIASLDENNVFVVGYDVTDNNTINVMFKTTDGGETWTAITVDIPEFKYKSWIDIHAIRSKTSGNAIGMVVGGRSTIAVSFDADKDNRWRFFSGNNGLNDINGVVVIGDATHASPATSIIALDYYIVEKTMFNLTKIDLQNLSNVNCGMMTLGITSVIDDNGGVHLWATSTGYPTNSACIAYSNDQGNAWIYQNQTENIIGSIRRISMVNDLRRPFAML